MAQKAPCVKITKEKPILIYKQFKWNAPSNEIRRIYLLLIKMNVRNALTFNTSMPYQIVLRSS